MQVNFRTTELASYYTDERAARKALGEQIAKAYVRQIDLLRAAATQADLSRVPQLHFKAMAKGTPLAGKYSIRLSGFMRLILSIEGQVITLEEVSKHYDDKKS
jgi:plasmid maintenance system killer protein